MNVHKKVELGTLFFVNLFFNGWVNYLSDMYIMFQRKKHGVFYPRQSFKGFKGTVVNEAFSLCIEVSLFIYFACLSEFVCLYPINDKTAEPYGHKLSVGPHMTPGKVYPC